MSNDATNPPLDPAAAPELHLLGLQQQFMEALTQSGSGDLEGAEETLRSILRVEPRLAEARLELARLLLENDKLVDAEAEGREALRILEAGGQWIADLAEPEVQSFAFDLVGEILRRRADSDEVLYGDPEVYKALVMEARSHFQRAVTLDPGNEHAGYWAFGLSLEE